MTQETIRKYTVTAPDAPWLSNVKAETLIDAVAIADAWEVNQGVHAIVLDPDGYIVSTLDRERALALTRTGWNCR